MINELLKSIIEEDKPSPRAAYIAPYRHQAKAVAWDYLKKYTAPIPGCSVNESELRVDLPGDRRLMLLGADNADALRGIYLDGVVLDDYGYFDPGAYQAVIRPSLVDRGGWSAFIGTPHGRNHFFDLARQMEDRQRLGDETVFAATYRASETGIILADELERAKAEMGPDLYAQEFECSFEAALKGAYYARQLEDARAHQRIRSVPWEPGLPVETFWDIGFADSTAIVFAQVVGREIHVIDYVEAKHETLSYYAREIQRRPYLYARHHLPHDAAREELSAGGKSIEEQLLALNVRPTRIVPASDVIAGIQAARLLFPRIFIDEVKCRRLIDCLSAYTQEWDRKKQDFKDTPFHDWASHGADAFRYLAVGLREMAVPNRWTTTPQRPKIKNSWSVLDYEREHLIR